MGLVETKIRVYEAFDNGIITESEKIEYLDVLNSFYESDGFPTNKYGDFILPYKIAGQSVTVSVYKGNPTEDDVKKDLPTIKTEVDLLQKKYSSEIFKYACEQYLDYTESCYNAYKDDKDPRIASYLKKCEAVIKSKGKLGLKFWSVGRTGANHYEFGYDGEIMAKDGHIMSVYVFIKDGKLLLDNVIDG